MLTRPQDAWQIHKIWKVVMLKVEPDDITILNQTATTLDSESPFMTNQCKVVSKTMFFSGLLMRSTRNGKE